MRYLCIAGTKSDLNGSAARQLLFRAEQSCGSWLRFVLSDSTIVLAAPANHPMERIHRFEERGLVILGNVFRWPSGDLDTEPRPVMRFTEDECLQIIDGGPRHLITRYWGWYIAFCATKHATWGFRSPACDESCQYSSVAGTSVFASEAWDLIRVCGQRPTIDWNILRLHVGLGQVATRGLSALSGVTILNRGEGVHLERGMLTRKQFWNPRDFISDGVTDEKHATSLLRARTQLAVRSWASLQTGIIVRLSGGFDSAVLAACLAEAAQTRAVVAVNLYWHESSGDERKYARESAQSSHIRLIERKFGCGKRLSEAVDVRRTAYPMLEIQQWQEQEADLDLAKSINASAIFTGILGDSLFQQVAYEDAIFEYGRAKPFDPSVLRVALDIAISTGQSIWRVLKRGLTSGGPKQRRNWSVEAEMLRRALYRSDRFLVHPALQEELLATVSELAHPWFKSVRGITTGKLLQIAPLITDGFAESPHARPEGPRQMGPFLSQPLIEACLRIPSYMNVERGHDRAVARRAFTSHIPQAIVRRLSKGTPDSWLSHILVREKDWIFAFLADGVLLRNDVLSRGKVLGSLPSMVTRGSANVHSTLNLIYTEAWARAWLNEPATSAS